MMAPPEKRTVDYKQYQDWRHRSLSTSWRAFSDSYITGKDVLDFGCGDGQLSLFLSKEKNPKCMIGVDMVEASIARARQSLSKAGVPQQVNVEFRVGSAESIPLEDRSIDTLLAFDCLEHVMRPAEILRECHRVLRPGGRCLIEWFPYKGPWGPHMEALIPVPWAHVIFGEQAVFRAAAAIYDLPEFVPRHWDLDENGDKKPNKWRAWSTFKEQGFINQLDIETFRHLARDADFAIDRLEVWSFGGSPFRRGVGKMCMSLPIVGEYFVSFTRVELRRPN
jgi:ubiquinone/menaquinone biosynthesis C-methylase UbiE